MLKDRPKIIVSNNVVDLNTYRHKKSLVQSPSIADLDLLYELEERIDILRGRIGSQNIYKEEFINLHNNIADLNKNIVQVHQVHMETIEMITNFQTQLYEIINALNK